MINLFLAYLISTKVFSASLDILKNDVSARIVGSAGSNSTVEDSVFAINYNPAGLAFINTFETGLSVSNGFDDAKYSYISVGTKTNFRVFSEFDSPGIGLSLYKASLGDFTLRTVDDYGNITEKTVNAENDIVLSFGYAEKIIDEKTYITPSVKSRMEGTFGIGIKYISSKLLDKYSADTFAVDAGYMGRLEDIGLDFGISLLNTMGKIKYLEEKNNLPTTLKVGISYSKPTIFDNTTRFSLGYDNYITDKKQSFKLGVEYNISSKEFLTNYKIAIRAGYKFDDNKGFTIGTGFYYGNFCFDLSTSFSTVYKYSFLSIRYKFSKQQEKTLEEKSKEKRLEKIKKKEQTTSPSPQPIRKPTESVIIVF